MTIDPELAEALRAAAEHLNPAMSAAEQIRHLALIGARSFPKMPDPEKSRQALEELDEVFADPENPWLDLERLREMVDARRAP